jgi:rod shape-determining protein MreC
MKLFNPSTKFFFIAIIAAGAIIFLNTGSAIGSFKDFSYGIFRYPQNFFAGISFGANGVLKFLLEIKNLEKDKIALTEENNSLKKEIFELKEARRENELLRSFLNTPSVKKRAIVDAAVIGKDPYSFSNFLIINRGREAGIGPGMVVLDSNGFFIGKISETGSGASKINTVMDTAGSIGGIDQESRVQGLIKNEMDSGLIFDMVAQDAKIKAGDTIIIALSSDNDYSEPVAKVVSVEKFPNKPFQKIKLALLADIKNIEKVFVVLK